MCMQEGRWFESQLDGLVVDKLEVQRDRQVRLALSTSHHLRFELAGARLNIITHKQGQQAAKPYMRHQSTSNTF